MSYNIEETDIQDLAVAKRKLWFQDKIETFRSIGYNVAIFFMSRPKCGKLFEQSLETGKEKALCLWPFLRPAVSGKEGCAAGDRELRVKTRRRKRNRY